MADELQRRVCVECWAIHFVASGQGQPVCRRCGGATAFREDDAKSDAAFRQKRYVVPRQRLKLSGPFEVHDSDGQPILFLDRPGHFRTGCGTRMTGCVLIVPLIVLLLVASFNARNFGEGLGIFLVGLAFLSVLSWLLIRWLTPTRLVQFYADRQRHRILMDIKARHGRFRCLTPDGEEFATFHKEKMGFLRKGWVCRDPQGVILLRALEDSVKMSVLRRVLGPILDKGVGAVVGFPMMILQKVLGGNLTLFPTNFILIRDDPANPLGTFDRGMTSFRSYILDLSGDRERKLDRRLALALAVVLEIDERG